MRNIRRLNQWATIYRGLGNQNRLKIMKLLAEKGPMSVTELSGHLRISFKNTSRNLRILQGLDLIEYEGRNDRVYYSLSKQLDDFVRRILKITFAK